ncbi:MAG: S41 family peptidase [bacterium]
MQNKSRPVGALLTVFLVATAFVVGFSFPGNHFQSTSDSLWTPLWSQVVGSSARGSTIDASSLKPVELYAEVLSRLQDEYIEDINDDRAQEMTYAAIRSMLHQLNDPYTRFMSPKEFKDFNSDNQGHFAGIGATLTMTEIPALAAKAGDGTSPPIICPVCGNVLSDTKHYRVAIVDTIANSPAQKAGLQSNDFILSVDSKITDGLTISEATDLIRGVEGTEVTLMIARKGIEKPIEVKITRARIEIPAVEWKMLDNNIGYIHLKQFNEKTVEQMKLALGEFNTKNVDGVLLDLRNDPGGLLSECVKVSGMFLPEDKKIIVSTKSRSGKSSPVEREPGDRPIYTKPLVVLVNKGSASASEILSGALKDYGRAQIVGESTFGKALVQTVIRVGDPASPAAMAVTTAHYYTPNGHDVGKIGLPPDIEVKLDEGVLKISESDNQAKEALRILKEKIAGK